MSPIHNERTKLSATALNGTAVTAIAAGFITPLAAASFGAPPARELAGMSLSEFYLMALGPLLALAAGAVIYRIAIVDRPAPPPSDRRR